MIVAVQASGWVEWPGGRARCALGEGGVVAASVKREGDGATPAGEWPLRRVLYRPDRGDAPRTALPRRPLEADDGWCDDPGDSRYNEPVRLPYGASAEALWREDHLYDLILVVGHNDTPTVPGAGSAIFIHVAQPDYAATRGCVALARPDLESLLALAAPGDAVAISLPDRG